MHATRGREGGDVENGGSRRILVAEDDAVTRAIFSRTLEKRGFIVEAVSDGQQALERLDREHIPILITDWNMPRLGGKDLCRKVREMDLPGYVYILIVTAEHDPDFVIEGLEAGADDFLLKPIARGELVARIETGIRIIDLINRLEAASARIEEISETDELTGVWNRRHLTHHLANEIERANRFADQLAVIMCDIDHFKRVNDRYGHLAGDAVLIEFARALGENLRDGVDWIARYGGEEFLIILPRTPLGRAVEVGERLRKTIAERVTVWEGVEIHITASFGVAGISLGEGREKPGMDALLSRADALLYQCKHEGRNRVIGGMWPPDSGGSTDS